MACFGNIKQATLEGFILGIERTSSTNVGISFYDTPTNAIILQNAVSGSGTLSYDINISSIVDAMT